MLQKEVVASFDKASHQKDLGTMAECALVMSQFERGDAVLMQVCSPLLYTMLCCLCNVLNHLVC